MSELLSPDQNVQPPSTFDRIRSALEEAPTYVAAGIAGLLAMNAVSAFEPVAAEAHGSSNLIVPGRSIGKYVVGESESKLPNPVSKEQVVDGGLGVWNYSGGVTVGLYGTQVTNVSTTSRKFQTSKGDGVGTPVAKLKRDLRGIKCFNEGGPDVSAQSLTCTLSSGTQRTTFSYANRNKGAQTVDVSRL